MGWKIEDDDTMATRDQNIAWWYSVLFSTVGTVIACLAGYGLLVALRSSEPIPQTIGVVSVVVLVAWFIGLLIFVGAVKEAWWDVKDF